VLDMCFSRAYSVSEAGGIPHPVAGNLTSMQVAQAMSQASRTERVTAAVTPDEKARIKRVAELRGEDVSNLLRVKPIRRILEDYDRLPLDQRLAA
jgi:hypothetical protein